MDGLIAWIPASIAMSGVVAGGVLWLLTQTIANRATQVEHHVNKRSNTFLLRDGVIVDDDLEPSSRDEGLCRLYGWEDLKAWLNRRFANLPQCLSQIPPGETRNCRLQDSRDPAFVSISTVHGGGHQVTLVDPEAPPPAARHELANRLEAKTVIEQAMETVPCAICALDSSGRVLWRNKAFRAFSAADEAQLFACMPAAGATAPELLALSGPASDALRHFELSREQSGDSTVLYAKDVSRLVEADNVRGSFIQTLSKTFADLAIGLAVFDRDRRLMLFNPALIDLTGLQASFLSAKPSLMAFIDRLRDQRVLPEPKNYASWREQISQTIGSAENGLYCEVWNLPSGLTYRVTGRPHPGGAVAFLIEDISDEITLTRRFRTQLETRQAVLDKMDEAIAVLGPNDLVVFGNASCQSLMGFDPESGFSELTLSDLLEICSARFPDETFWESAKQKLAGNDERPRLIGRLSDGAECRIEPLPGRFVMVALKPADSLMSLSA